MLEKILESEKRRAHRRLRPIEKRATCVRDENIFGIQVEVSQGIREVELTEPQENLAEVRSHFPELARCQRRGVQLDLFPHEIGEILKERLEFRNQTGDAHVASPGGEKWTCLRKRKDLQFGERHCSGLPCATVPGGRKWSARHFPR